MTLGKFPCCSYNVDMYTNWLTQNSVNVDGYTFTSDQLAGLNSISNGVFGLAKNIVSGNILGGGESLVNGSVGIAQSLIQKKQHELIPNAIRGDINNGDVVTASNNNNFKFYRMSVRKEYAQIIDEYFSMYGYSINRVKIPNITGRRYWNYVKTINCNCVGEIPNNDLNLIRKMFDNGITLWHNPNTMYDYSLSNVIEGS